MWVETARLRTTSPRNARRSYDSPRSPAHEECVNACRARSSGSSSRRGSSVVARASGRLCLRVGGDEVGGLSDGQDLHRFFVRDANAVAILELHDELDEVERVGLQVLLETRALADAGRVHAQLRREMRPDQLQHLVSSQDSWRSKQRARTI